MFSGVSLCDFVCSVVFHFVTLCIQGCLTLCVQGCLCIQGCLTFLFFYFFNFACSGVFDCVFGGV